MHDPLELGFVFALSPVTLLGGVVGAKTPPFHVIKVL